MEASESRQKEWRDRQKIEEIWGKVDSSGSKRNFRKVITNWLKIQKHNTFKDKKCFLLLTHSS